VTTAKGYAKHEKEVFETITKARSEAQQSNNVSERFKSESIIHESTGQIIALTESYPELKADKQFELLQRNLSEVEAQITAARRSYNASVTAFNTSLQTVPSNIIAGIHGFQEMDLFSINVSERSNVDVS